MPDVADDHCWARAHLEAVRAEMLQARVARRTRQARVSAAPDAPTGGLDSVISRAERSRQEAFWLMDLVAHGMGQQVASVLEAYYVRGYTWGQVAHEASASVSTCLRWRDRAVAWMDAVGRSRFVSGVEHDAGAGMGTEVPTMQCFYGKVT